PVQHGEKLQVHIVRVDHFGNLITDMLPPHFTKWNPNKAVIDFEFGHTHFVGPVQLTYSDAADGAPVAYFGSGGRLEIAISNGHASNYFNVKKGATIMLSKL